MQSTKTAQTIQYETYSIASSQTTNNATIDVIASTLHNVGVRSSVDSILSSVLAVISVAVVVTVVDRSVDDDGSNNDKGDDALDTTEVVPVDASSSSIGNACNVVDEESMGEGVSNCCFCNKDLVDDDVGGGTNALQQ